MLTSRQLPHPSIRLPARVPSATIPAMTARRSPAALLALPLLLFLLAPVAVLVVPNLGAALVALARDGELRDALGRTALAACLAALLAAVLGTPLAWLLARRPFPGRALVEAALDLPLVLPHPVAGLALLLVLGRQSPVGGALLELGLRIVGSLAGTTAAMLFVSAPLFVSAARASFAAVDEEHELVAGTLGAGPWRRFWRVSLPLASRGLLAGAVVAWARAISEFGAVVVVAYHPRVASTLAYERFTGYGLSEALPVAAALALVALVPLVALRAIRGAR
ncbi:hypothetical protein rosag_32200 [Roseisolibacter agri]|uniref:ABC transmembrane type-1 domain-containing protein n=2 Tax=Roseisolibacter agri TaxID=2014610 RepID=A0AA37Q8L6_9BACT|nr:hypothetical protein rosag_32200 [Roseisolibacter agri]